MQIIKQWTESLEDDNSQRQITDEWPKRSNWTKDGAHRKKKLLCTKDIAVSRSITIHNNRCDSIWIDLLFIVSVCRGRECMFDLVNRIWNRIRLNTYEKKKLPQTKRDLYNQLKLCSVHTHLIKWNFFLGKRS